MAYLNCRMMEKKGLKSVTNNVCGAVQLSCNELVKPLSSYVTEVLRMFLSAISVQTFNAK
jgi:hypothetical protein